MLFFFSTRNSQKRRAVCSYGLLLILYAAATMSYSTLRAFLAVQCRQLECRTKFPRKRYSCRAETEGRLSFFHPSEFVVFKSNVDGCSSDSSNCCCSGVANLAAFCFVLFVLLFLNMVQEVLTLREQDGPHYFIR